VITRTDVFSVRQDGVSKTIAIIAYLATLDAIDASLFQLTAKTSGADVLVPVKMVVSNAQI
jgi:hypothetical protein